MVSSSRLLGSAVLCLVVLSGAWCPPSLGAARHADTETDLQARLEREQNPVKKAKYEVRLGRVKLTEAIAAYDKGDLDGCNALAAAYLGQMKSAWQRLRSTGRNALKKPEGFRDLDIALREDARLIADLERRIPYNDRGPLTEVAHEVEQIHGEVLAALFPSGEPSKPKKHPRGGATRWLGSPVLAPKRPRPESSSGAMPALADSRWLSRAAADPAPGAFPQTRKDVLTDDEADKLRDQQDPGKRIELYLAFAQERLDRFLNFRSQPADPKYDTGEYLDRLLGEYVAVDDELKDWIENQYERGGDMRGGLHALLERGPKQLEMLRQVQHSPDAFARDYQGSLRDAIDDLTDTLDGATQALASQEKKFGELKREAKADARASKEREKEEKKRTKEEKKLRKREHKRGNPTEADDG
jgi:hypothetical protein